MPSNYLFGTALSEYEAIFPTEDFSGMNNTALEHGMLGLVNSLSNCQLATLEFLPVDPDKYKDYKNTGYYSEAYETLIKALVHHYFTKYSRSTISFSLNKNQTMSRNLLVSLGAVKVHTSKRVDNVEANPEVNFYMLEKKNYTGLRETKGVF